MREKEPELSRGFVINTHRRQFWQAQIPYLSRRTLGKGLLSWCMGCMSESWSSPFSVSSGNRQSSPHIHLKESRKQTAVLTSQSQLVFSNFLSSSTLPCPLRHRKPKEINHIRPCHVSAMIKAPASVSPATMQEKKKIMTYLFSLKRVCDPKHVVWKVCSLYRHIAVWRILYNS